jgi:hypothetical protein
MNLSGFETASLLVALWGVALTTWLAIRGWMRGRTRIGLDINRNLRMGDNSHSWQWILFEVTIRNASEKAIAITEYGLHFRKPDSSIVSGTVVHFSEMPNGDTILEDPNSQFRRAIDAHLTFLETPVNLSPRGADTGWIGFYFDLPLPRKEVESGKLQLVVVDHERKTWTQEYEGMGESKPYRSPRTTIVKAR